ncbi:hypothetical protein [Chromobacterium haemolyticum]|uniref:Uncharacterized protein n=1 Tax=Chromobacterium haemolyticum TaxID=394935 RepID=A0A1W0DAJ9_9NEIS|nr:hypothetical protein [Chromobacterium haemolyticum]OQS44030.1 hypothetical protein B0T45_00020 [Chromobacterium haemolyticum]
MSAIARTLSTLRRQLALALPDRLISPDLIDHSNRQRDELERGVVTAVLPEVAMDEWQDTLQLKLVGQVAVAERDTTQQDVERAELRMLQQLRAFLRNPGGDLPRLRCERALLSGQFEYPFGWVALDVACGPLDLSDSPDDELYPPPVAFGQLTHAHLDIDAPPHESAAEHQKWLAGDYSGSKPEADMDLKLRGDDPNGHD